MPPQSPGNSQANKVSPVHPLIIDEDEDEKRSSLKTDSQFSKDGEDAKKKRDSKQILSIRTTK
jgi:hypothetical protein